MSNHNTANRNNGAAPRTSRRKFLQTSAALGGASLVSLAAPGVLWKIWRSRP